MAGLVSVLLLLTLQFTTVDCGKRTLIKWVFKPYGIQMCRQLCLDSSDIFCYVQEDLSCHRISLKGSVSHTNLPEESGLSPPEVPNADIVCGCDVLNPVVTYKCRPDFKPCGLQTESRRQASGEWTAVGARCARFRWNKPAVPFHEHLPCKDQDVMHLIIKARPTRAGMMVFMLRGDTDDLLYAECRFNFRRRHVVLNNRKNGKFGREVRPRAFPFAVNKNFIMVITRSNGIYKISVEEHTWNFPERGVGEIPKELLINRDIRVEDIEIHI